MSLKLRMIQAYYAQQREASFPDMAGLAQYSVPQAVAARLNIRRPAAEVVGPVVSLLTILFWLPAFADYNISLWLFVGLGFLLAILGLRYPVAGLFGVGILMALDPVTRIYLQDVSFYRFNTLIYWLLVVIGLNIPLLLRLDDVHTRLLEILCLLLGLQVLIGSDLTYGVQQTLDIGITLGFMVYISRVLQEKGAFYWLAVILGLLAGIGGLIYNLRFAALPYLNPNSWAFFPAAALIVISLGFFQERGSPRRSALLLVLFGVNYSWIFLSGSRGNMLTGLICFLFILWHVRKKSWTPLVMVVAVLLAYWLTLQMPEQFEYALRKMDITLNENASAASRTSGRSTLVEGGLKIFLSNPLGTGTGSFRERYAEISEYGYERPAHTAWITVLVENGFPGIVLLVAYLASFTWVGWSKRKEGLLTLGLLVTLTVSIAFISREFGSKALFFLTAAGASLLNKELTIKAIREPDPLRVLRSFTYLKDYWKSPDQNPSAHP